MRVFHIDGVPMSHMESITPGVPPVTYRTFCIFGRDVFEVASAAAGKVDEIEDAAMRAAERDGSRPIVVWRKRPEIVRIENENGTLIEYKARFRVATIPALTEESWEDLGFKKEGGTA